jgi:hypothetical protein
MGGLIGEGAQMVGRHVPWSITAPNLSCVMKPHHAEAKEEKSNKKMMMMAPYTFEVSSQILLPPKQN